MKRWLTGLSLMVLLMLAVVGCGGAKPGGGGAGTVSYETLKPGTEPGAVAKELAQIEGQAGFKVMTLDGKTYVLIAGGEKPSGGWSVEVDSVRKADGAIEVSYRVKAPAQGSMVTQAITYPTAVVTFVGSDGLTVNVKEIK